MSAQLLPEWMCTPHELAALPAPAEHAVSRPANAIVMACVVAKVVTALYALETLGSEYRFVTELIATGPIVDGRLDGDLYLVGGSMMPG